jgi:SnoaL-like domain
VSADHAATVRRYHELWTEPDAARRLRDLSEIWSEDGVYVDPDVPEGVRGADGLSEYIGTSQADLPGLVILTTTPISVLTDRAWYRWAATTNDGQAATGLDVIELAPDGRIRRVTNFFDE